LFFSDPEFWAMRLGLENEVLGCGVQELIRLFRAMHNIFRTLVLRL
jgi:hypothetical protein